VIGCEDRLRNDLYCVEWGVKLYYNQLLVLAHLVVPDKRVVKRVCVCVTATTSRKDRYLFNLLSTRMGLVMYIIPYHGIVMTSRIRSTNSKDEPGIKCSPQQPIDFIAFSIIRQKCASMSSMISLARVWMSLLK